MEHLLAKLTQPKSTWLSRFDLRIILALYAFSALMPWFVYKWQTLAFLLAYNIIMAFIGNARILSLVLMAVSVAGNILILAAGIGLYGYGRIDIEPVFVLTAKLVILSLASISLFSGMEPERLGDAFLKMGFPMLFSFSISFGFRVLPLLTREYGELLTAYTLRSHGGKKQGLIRKIKILIKVFYPMILNTAKRIRTTVEALELKGLGYAAYNQEARNLRLSYMRLTWMDWSFLAAAIGTQIIILFAT